MVADMMTTGFHGLELAGVEFGNSVAVIGIGPVGLMAVAGAVLRGAARVIVAGGDKDAFKSAVKMAKTGGNVANINFFTNIENLSILDILWGCGLAHKTIVGELCPGGRLRMEKLLELVRTKRVNSSLLITHRFNSLEGAEPAFKLIVDKPTDSIKPIVIIE